MINEHPTSYLRLSTTNSIALICPLQQKTAANSQQHNPYQSSSKKKKRKKEEEETCEQEAGKNRLRFQSSFQISDNASRKTHSVCFDQELLDSTSNFLSSINSIQHPSTQLGSFQLLLC